MDFEQLTYGEGTNMQKLSTPLKALILVLSITALGSVEFFKIHCLCKIIKFSIKVSIDTTLGRNFLREGLNARSRA